MRPILQIVSLVALIGLIVPSIIFLAGRMELDTVKWLMLNNTIFWFVAATPLMWKDNGAEKQDAA